MTEIDGEGDGEAVGSRGSSGGAPQRQLELWLLRQGSGELSVCRGQIGEGAGARVIRGKRGVEWCAEIGKGEPVFIGEGRSSGARAEARR